MLNKKNIDINNVDNVVFKNYETGEQIEVSPKDIALLKMGILSLEDLSKKYINDDHVLMGASTRKLNDDDQDDDLPDMNDVEMIEDIMLNILGNMKDPEDEVETFSISMVSDSEGIHTVRAKIFGAESTVGMFTNPYQATDAAANYAKRFADHMFNKSPNAEYLK